MKIARISATNFKGSSFDHRPGAVTIFHGPNGAGKSSALEAIRLGMLGYDPRIPKKKPEMFKSFASGSPMRVEVEFDSGKSNVIELIEKKGTITGEIAINEEFPDLLLDLSDYWKASKADRAQLLMSLCVTTENIANLKALKGIIEAVEKSISSDMSRRKTLQEGIAAKVSADIEIKIQEPPKDLASEIEANKKSLQEAQGHLQWFSGERATRLAQENALASLQQAQARAVKDTPEPVCEHCGNQVQYLKNLANSNFQEPLAEAFTKLGCMRQIADIDASIKEWTDYVNRLRLSIAQMEQQQQAWIKHCGSQGEDQRMQEELDVIEPRLEKNRGLLKEAVESRKALLADSVAPLLAKANLLLAPVMDMSLVIEEGEIGFRSDRFIPFVSLSDSQEGLAVAGLQLALSGDSKCKIVVMDRLERYASETKVKLMDTIYSLLQFGTIDQFLGADVSNKGYGKLSKKCFVEVVR